MACAIVNITSGESCQLGGGIINDLRIAKLSDIDLGTTALTANVITTWAMTSTNVFKKFDIDAQNSNYENVYDGSVNTQTLNIAFLNKTAAQIKALNDLKDCCKLVVALRHGRDANWRVFGLDLDIDGTTLVGSQVQGLMVTEITDNSGAATDKLVTSMVFTGIQYNTTLFATDEPPLT